MDVVVTGLDVNELKFLQLELWWSQVVESRVFELIGFDIGERIIRGSAPDGEEELIVNSIGGDQLFVFVLPESVVEEIIKLRNDCKPKETNDNVNGACVGLNRKNIDDLHCKDHRSLHPASHKRHGEVFEFVGVVDSELHLCQTLFELVLKLHVQDDCAHKSRKDYPEVWRIACERRAWQFY